MDLLSSKFLNINNLNNKRSKSFIIAEIAQAHEGSLGIAHSYIDAVAKAGVDAVKFQTHIADAESTKDEEFRVNIFPQDKNRFEYWKRMEFTFDQWQGLYKHAEEKGLVFLSSPFSIAAIDLLLKLNIKAWKIGSGEFFSENLLNRLIETNLPLLVSTGMSLKSEIKDLVEKFNKLNVNFALMQCTSKYPTKLNEIGLQMMHDFRSSYKCLVGLSDHSGTIYPSLLALAQGCDFLEVHTTFDRRIFGPDSQSSLDIKELELICNARDNFDKIINSKFDKDQLSQELISTKKLFSKSLTLNCNLKKGQTILERYIVLKKPGTGIPYNQKQKIIGKKVSRDIYSNEILKWEDLE